MSDHINKFFNNCMCKNCVNERSLGKHIYRFPLQTNVKRYLWIRNSDKFMFIYKYS